MKKIIQRHEKIADKPMRIFGIMLLALMTSLTCYAQGADPKTTNISYSTDFISLQSRLKSLDPPAAAHFQSLVTDLYPSVYLTHGQLKIYGSGAPVVAECDAASVNMLYGNDPAFSQVELIKLRVNSSVDLPSAIDLTRMQGFTNLRSLLVIFAYDVCRSQSDDCLAAVLSGIIQGASSSPVIVSYKLSIPE